MNATTWIAVASLALTVLGLTITARALRNKTDDTHTAQLAEYTDSLEHRIADAEGREKEMIDDLKDCKRARDDFERKYTKILLDFYDLKRKVNGDAD